ncbi:SDR family oxidoreductase [Parahaliea maris]|uniref:SDR family oxidoreductase n=1 Tax=Parahaliea maris TaxID=2716870 RepID=A0A5C9A7U5_9GAMM|nr:SDR family oxidoreductase [Parahaliea maris]TXS96104.1 SDR family oxidoreductase [Parahaliea maris]
MDSRFEGKVALVTGAGGFVGGATARMLAGEGARVIYTDLREVPPIPEVEEKGGRFVCHNVAEEAAWVALIEQVSRDYGQLDLVTNIAAICNTVSLPDDTVENWRITHQVNAESVFLSAKHALPLLEQSGGGAIINVSSIAAMRGSPLTPAYAASKAAVMSLTQSIAVHCADAGNSVRCNSVHPGAIDPPMFRQGLDAETRMQLTAEFRETHGRWMCQPEDIARSILFLGSDDACHINGVALPVDNSATASLPY